MGRTEDLLSAIEDFPFVKAALLEYADSARSYPVLNDQAQLGKINKMQQHPRRFPPKCPKACASVGESSPAGQVCTAAVA